MSVIFKRPHALLDVPTHYCPGCGHGIIHRLVAEVIDEMGIEGETVGICPVGCAVMAYDYFGCDMVEAPHGRAPAVATGVLGNNNIPQAADIRLRKAEMQTVGLTVRRCAVLF